MTAQLRLPRSTAHQPARCQPCYAALRCAAMQEVSAALRVLYLDAVRQGCEDWWCQAASLEAYMEAVLPGARTALLHPPKKMLRSAAAAGRLELAPKRKHLRGSDWLRLAQAPAGGSGGSVDAAAGPAGAAGPAAPVSAQRLREIEEYVRGRAAAPGKKAKKRKLAEQEEGEPGGEEEGGAGAQQAQQAQRAAPSKVELGAMRLDLALHCLAAMQVGGGGGWGLGQGCWAAWPGHSLREGEAGLAACLLWARSALGLLDCCIAPRGGSQAGGTCGAASLRQSRLNAAGCRRVAPRARRRQLTPCAPGWRRRRGRPAGRGKGPWQDTALSRLRGKLQRPACRCVKASSRPAAAARCGKGCCVLLAASRLLATRSWPGAVLVPES